MEEMLLNMICAYLIGGILGLAYCRGATVMLSLSAFLVKTGLSLTVLASICVYFQWKEYATAFALALGICAGVWLSIWNLKHNLPWHFTRRRLAARPGEEEPAIGRQRDRWLLSYEDGQVVSYDARGKICRYDFPDGTSWDLSQE